MQTSKKKTNKWLALTTTSVGTFMSTLNASIVNIANPVLAAEFGITMAQVQWVSTIYLIVTSSLMLLFGRVGDRVGAHRIYIAGIALFTLGSFTCAVVNTFELLLLARAIQGLGAAMTVATSMGLIVTIFPLEQRGRAMGFTVLMVGLGNVTGPVVGGVILAATTWHVVFLISAPFGFVAFLMAAIWLRSPLPKKDSVSLDVLGSLLFAGVITCLIIFLSGGFSGQEWFGLGVIACGILLCLVERRALVPLLDAALMKNKRFALGNIIVFFSYCSYMMIFFQLPFFLQTVWNIPVGMVGLLMMISALALAFTGPISGFFSDKIGALKVMVPALFAILAGVIAALFLGLEESLVLFVLIMVLSGAGMGFLNTPNNSDIMTAAGREKSSYASGFVGTNRNLAFAIGTALSASVFQWGSSLSSQFSAVIEAYGGGMVAEHLFGFKVVVLASLLMVVLSLVACLYLKYASKDEDHAKQETEKVGKHTP